jgi:hypothetical protein
LIAITWGLAVFGETARSGPGPVVAAAGVVLLSVGVVFIARSPVLEHHATTRPAVRPLR